jgi:hypothetical protein
LLAAIRNLVCARVLAAVSSTVEANQTISLSAASSHTTELLKFTRARRISSGLREALKRGKNKSSKSEATMIMTLKLPENSKYGNENWHCE